MIFIIAAAALCIGQGHFHLPDRLVEQEGRRNRPDPSG